MFILGKEKFILKSRKKHGDKFNYDKFIYISSQTKGIITCPIHGDFETTPEIHYKCDCLKCANSSNLKKKKHTKDFIKNLLFNKNIEIVDIDNCDNFLTKLKYKFKCTKCETFWITSLNNLMKHNNPTHCPNCSNKSNLKLTNNIIDERIKNKNFKRLDNFNGNAYQKINWLCFKCNKTWKANVNNILYLDRECPNCFKFYTDEFVDNHIKIFNKKVERLSSIGNGNALSLIKFKCLDCNTIFETGAASLIHSKFNCCTNCIYKGEKQIYDILKNKFNILEIKKNKYIKINNRRRFFDFYLINNNVEYYIERQGEQHYKAVNFGGGCDYDKIYKETLIGDQQKRDWCKENNKILIEIPYYMSENEIINILNETFNYHVTPNKLLNEI